MDRPISNRHGRASIVDQYRALARARAVRARKAHVAAMRALTQRLEQAKR